MGRQGVPWGGGERRLRNSKDKRRDRVGERLVEFMKNRGWSIFNSSIRGDEEGESLSQEEEDVR